MANREHFGIYSQGTSVWNKWREDNPHIEPDLSGAALSGSYNIGMNLRGTNLARANCAFMIFRNMDLRSANFMQAHLIEADFTGANLEEANFSGANLTEAKCENVNLRRANLIQANLSCANFARAHFNNAWLWDANMKLTILNDADLTMADLNGADLRGAFLVNAILHGTNLMNARLVMAKLNGADFKNCGIYGISVWDSDQTGSTQSNLIITPPSDDKQYIAVDSLELGQFLYLLLYNKRIRHIIDTITSKVVLILGRFTPKRKTILEGIKEALRKSGYIPVLFDFEKPVSRDTLETISTLAHLSRFVIADLTDARSVLQELQRIVPSLPSVPVQPLLQNSYCDPGMIDHFKNFHSFLNIYKYDNADDLLLTFRANVIANIENLIGKLE